MGGRRGSPEEGGLLELGRAGTEGTGKHEAPVLRDGAVVARLHVSNWRESATAVVGDREWVFSRQGRELTGRWAADPEGTARLHARETSVWRGTWALDLEGTAVEMRTASWRRGSHHFVIDGRPVAEGGALGTWVRRPTLTDSDAFTLDQQVFLLWVELILQRRAAAGAAAAGAAAGAR